MPEAKAWKLRLCGGRKLIGSYEDERIIAGFNKLIAWDQRRGLVPGATLIGMSRDDPEITPMNWFAVSIRVLQMQVIKHRRCANVKAQGAALGHR